MWGSRSLIRLLVVRGRGLLVSLSSGTVSVRSAAITIVRWLRVVPLFIDGVCKRLPFQRFIAGGECWRFGTGELVSLILLVRRRTQILPATLAPVRRPVILMGCRSLVSAPGAARCRFCRRLRGRVIRLSGRHLNGRRVLVPVIW